MAYKSWLEAGEIADRQYTFDALVFALFESAPRDKLGRLKHAFPAHWNEYRYRAERPDGILPSDPLIETNFTPVTPRVQHGDDYPPEFIRSGKKKD